MAIDFRLVSVLLEYAKTELIGVPYLRHILLQTLKNEYKILEIGAGGFPLCNKESHPNYRIMDFYSTEEIAKHFEHDYGIVGAKDCVFPEVDFVCKDGRLANSVGDMRFDVVYSSHAIEHQPCIVSHLQQIDKLLDVGGAVVFIIPEKNCTFDFLRQTSTTGEILCAYHSGRRVPKGAVVFDFFSRHINLNPGRKLTRDDKFLLSHSIFEAYGNFVRSLEQDSDYIDIHNWVFTPDSFVLIALELYMLGLSPFFPQAVSEVNGNEFMCVLSRQPKPGDHEIKFLEEFRMQLYRQILWGDGFEAENQNYINPAI